MRFLQLRQAGLVLAIATLATGCYDKANRSAYDASEIILMSTGLLLEAFHRQSGAYPDPGYSGPFGDLPALHELRELAGRLEAQRPFLTLDAWGTDLDYIVSQDGQHYALVSAGADLELDGFVQLGGPPKHIETFDEDVIFEDGRFRQWLGAWCCNPDYRSEHLLQLQQKIRDGSLG